MPVIFMSNITNNQREVLQVKDSISKVPFALQGNSSDGSLNVNITSATISGGLTNNNAAPAANNLGVLPAIANAAAPSYSEGKQVLLSTDLSGALRITGSISVGGTTDNSAFTAGSSQGTPAMGFYHSVIDTVTDGRAAAAAITPKRGLHSNLRDSSGNELLGQKAMAASIPVALATDQASIPVAATLNAETTKVIGVVRTADGSGNLLTSTSSALDVNLKTLISGEDQTNNLLQVAGNVASAASDVGGPVKIGGRYNSTKPTFTNGQRGDLQIDTKGNLLGVIKDAAGNDRGANVNASNQLSISVDNNPVLGAGSAVIGHVITDSGSVTTATLNAETTKVIGTVRTADGSGNLYTSNSTTYTAKNAQDSNLLGTLGTAFSTAGKVDVKSAAGDVLNSPSASTSAVGSTLSYQSALSSTKTQIKGTAANLYGYRIQNPNNSTVYIQLFNLASASVTVGSTSPTDVIAIPAGVLIDESFAVPDAFGTALTVAATTTATGSTAPASALVATFRYV